ncbi:MAG TPA: class I SAM-dependent methyltransferase [Candidatus Sulfotelmatobacter sp.]
MRITNAFRRLLQAYGTETAKRRLWDKEFAQGRWKNLDFTPDDCVYGLIAKYANRESILDLGCGSGNTGNELPADAYGDYTGIDISEVALEKARQRSEKNARGEKNRFFPCDVASYHPKKKFDVILFRETIYYVPRSRIRSMLERYSAFLKRNGVFIVRLWDGRKHYRRIVELIESKFHVVEKFSPQESDVMVLVFRSRSQEQGEGERISFES